METYKEVYEEVIDLISKNVCDSIEVKMEPCEVEKLKQCLPETIQIRKIEGRSKYDYQIRIPLVKKSKLNIIPIFVILMLGYLFISIILFLISTFKFFSPTGDFKTLMFSIFMLFNCFVSFTITDEYFN
ncbi:MAG: hypothetical protein RSE41_03640 [Clostridia bacterium]